MSFLSLEHRRQPPTSFPPAFFCQDLTPPATCGSLCISWKEAWQRASLRGCFVCLHPTGVRPNGAFRSFDKILHKQGFETDVQLPPIFFMKCILIPPSRIFFCCGLLSHPRGHSLGRINATKIKIIPREKISPQGSIFIVLFQLAFLESQNISQIFLFSKNSHFRAFLHFFA